MIDLQSEKITDTAYNDTTYIDKEITKNGMVVSGDIVFVDGWQFEIDRSVPKIETSLGKGEKEETIGINITSTVTSDYVKANVVIEIIYEKEIEKIIINGEEIANIGEPEKQNGKNIYRIEKEEMNNTTYTVIAKDKEEKYNIASIKITDITEDMDIWNKQDMEEFRDKVNSGRTFEGRTARLMDNIDLEGSEESQWVAIGTEETSFKGIFEGNYHTIDNLYIKSNQQRNQALFAKTGNSNTIIKNLVMKNVYVYNNWDYCHGEGDGPIAGGIVADGNFTIYNCGIESGEITAIKPTFCSSYISYAKAGGIVGRMFGNVTPGKIYNCYNKANITAKGDTRIVSKFDTGLAGGICALDGPVIMENCYNFGKITAQGHGGYVGGISNTLHDGGIIRNCYNIGEISFIGTSSGRGEITAAPHAETIQSNNYTTNVTKEGLGNENWLDDVENINKGYPILKWQLNLNK